MIAGTFRLALLATVLAACSASPRQDVAAAPADEGLRVLDPVQLRNGTVVLPVHGDATVLRATDPMGRPGLHAVVVGHRIDLTDVTDGLLSREASLYAPFPELTGIAPGAYDVEHVRADGERTPLRTVAIRRLPTSRHGGTASSSRWHAVQGSAFDARVSSVTALQAESRFAADGKRRQMTFPAWIAVDGFWTPSDDEVKRAEARIVETLIRSQWAPEALGDLDPERRAWYAREVGGILENLDGYDVQVAGIVVDGRRRIVASFHPPRYASEDWVIVDDGGNSFWRIQYDLEDDCCLDFDCNGYA